MKGKKDERQDDFGCFFVFLFLFCIRFYAPGTLLGNILLYHDVHLLVCLCLPVGFVFLDLCKVPLSPSLMHTADRMHVCIYAL